jgi:hypothetical protein
VRSASETGGLRTHLEGRVAFKVLLRSLPNLKVTDKRFEERIGVSVVRQLFYVKRKFLLHRQTTVQTLCVYKKNLGHLQRLKGDKTLGIRTVNFIPLLFS